MARPPTSDREDTGTNEAPSHVTKDTATTRRGPFSGRRREAGSALGAPVREEQAPDRVPLIAGRRVAPAAAIIPAALGGLGLVALWDTMPLAWFGLPGFRGVGFSNGWWMVLARVCIMASEPSWTAPFTGPGAGGRGVLAHEPDHAPAHPAARACTRRSRQDPRPESAPDSGETLYSGKE